MSDLDDERNAFAKGIEAFGKMFDPIEKKRKRNIKMQKLLDKEKKDKDLDNEYLRILEERKSLRVTMPKK